MSYQTEPLLDDCAIANPNDSNYQELRDKLKGFLTEQEAIKQQERDKPVLEVLSPYLSSTPENAAHAAQMIVNRVNSLTHQVRRLTSEIEVMSLKERKQITGYCTFADGVNKDTSLIKCECQAGLGKMSPTCYYYREATIYNTDNDPLPDEAPPDFED